MNDENALHPTLVHEWLERSARLYPDKTALVGAGGRWTYSELDRQSTAVGKALAGPLGVKPGDRVVIFLDNSVETVQALYGVLKVGGVFSVVSASLKAQKLAYILENSGARALIAHTSKRAIVSEAIKNVPNPCKILWVGADEDIPSESASVSESWNAMVAGDGAGASDTLSDSEAVSPRTGETDLAALIYTSGSTGEPKGVMSSHLNMVSAAQSIIRYLENTERDVVLNVLPLSFDYGLYQALMTTMFGGTLVLEKSFVFLHPLLKRIAEEGVTGFPMVPTILAMLLKMQDLGQYDMSSLRYMTNTGAAVPVEHIRGVRSLLPDVSFYSMFGLTECKRVSYLPPEELDRRPASVGKAMPDCAVAVVDQHGQEVPPGTVGELVIRGPNVMQGYWKDDELTARSFRTDPSTGERVLFSGDEFRCDEDGFLYFVARKDDMIKTRGERVSPKEVEDIICSMPGVSEAAVVPEPDPLLGQTITAFIVAMPGVELTERHVLKFCTANMEPFMVPKRVVLLDELPKTPNGKIDKKRLLIREESES